MSEYLPGLVHKPMGEVCSAIGEPVRLVPSLSDADIAADLKRRMIEAFQPILALCDEAEAKGFVLAYGSGKGPLGKQVITQLVVAKHF